MRRHIILVLSALAVGAAAGPRYANTNGAQEDYASMGQGAATSMQQLLFRTCDRDNDGRISSVKGQGKSELFCLLGGQWTLGRRYSTEDQLAARYPKGMSLTDFLTEATGAIEALKSQYTAEVHAASQRVFFQQANTTAVHNAVAASLTQALTSYDAGRGEDVQELLLLAILLSGQDKLAQFLELAEDAQGQGRWGLSVTIAEIVEALGLHARKSTSQEIVQVAKAVRDASIRHGPQALPLCELPVPKPVENEWLRKLKAKPDSNCPSVDAADLDAEKMRAMIDKGKPFIIRNVVDSTWPAQDRWTPAAMRQDYGELVVDTHMTPSGSFFTTQKIHGKIWAMRPAAELMMLQDALTCMTLPRDLTNASFYLEYVDVATDMPRLARKLPLPRFLWGQPLRSVKLWAGLGGTISCVHFDSHENALVQLVGEKEFIVFPSSDAKYLEYGAYPGIYYHYKLPGQFFQQEVPQDVRRNNAALHLHEPLPANHQLDKTSPYRCRIREGDALYTPAYWHHQVESFPSQNCTHYPLSNVAVNFWFADRNSKQSN